MRLIKAMFVRRTNLQNYVEYHCLKILIFIVCLFGKPFAYFFGKTLILVFYYIIPIRKKQVLENISLSFPEKTKRDISAIARNTYRTFMEVFVDMLFIYKMTDDEVEKFLICDRRVIDKALAKGKGLVLMSAHLGNWELSMLALAKKYKVATIVAKQSNDLVNTMMDNFRNKNGFRITNFQRDDKMSFRGIVKALKENQIFAILGDQNAGSKGVFLPFFGRLASTPRGPAFFAIRAQSPIFTAFGVRQSDGSMKFKLEELILPNTGNEENDIKIINSIYNKRLEIAIRANPDQWFWFHRRWNTKFK